MKTNHFFSPNMVTVQCHFEQSLRSEKSPTEEPMWNDRKDGFGVVTNEIKSKRKARQIRREKLQLSAFSANSAVKKP